MRCGFKYNVIREFKDGEEYAFVKIMLPKLDSHQLEPIELDDELKQSESQQIIEDKTNDTSKSYIVSNKKIESHIGLAANPYNKIQKSVNIIATDLNEIKHKTNAITDIGLSRINELHNRHDERKEQIDDIAFNTNMTTNELFSFRKMFDKRLGEISDDLSTKINSIELRLSLLIIIIFILDILIRW